MSDGPRRDGSARDGLLLDVHLATMTAARGYGEVRDAAIAWQDGVITWLGPEAELPAALRSLPTQRCGGAWVTPGLIDCHTHLVYAGDRADEFEARLSGVTYEEIARRGGGILSTVRATRAADDEALIVASLPRVRALVADGVTTVEIKSGYGLTDEAERRMLRVARALGPLADVSVRTTFLGAHAVPPEYAGDADAWIDHLIPMLRGLDADAVDAFCETIGFSPAQTRRLFEAAVAAGLPVKLHAEQLSDQGGAALVAELGGLSADHLEHLSPSGVAAMAAAGTVAVLLPGAFYWLRETKLPPIDALRAAGVPMAVATDHNPGTSPLLSLRTAMNMACVLFRLTPAEALAGATCHAARALGLGDRGRLAVGLRADLCLWRVGSPAELSYGIGGDLLLRRVHAGLG